MMNRLSVAAVVAATATLLAHVSADMAPVETAMADSTSPGDGEEEEAMYLGCFHDNKGDRVLGDKLASPDMSHQVCLDYCTDLGATFMATQYGFECWCSPDGGLDYNRHYKITGEDALCDMECMGDESETCGGYDSFELYQLRPVLGGCEPVKPYDQCGGVGYTGSTCCPEGYWCIEMGGVKGCFSQCRPATVVTTPAPMDTYTEEPVDPSPTPTSTPGPVDMPTPATTPGPVDPPTPGPVATPAPAPVESPTPEPVDPTPEPTPEPTPVPVAATPTPQPIASPEPEPQPVGVGQYGTTYTGKATYYGFTTDGNCAYRDAVPGMYDGMIPIALNNDQYGDSLMCGACLEGTANGNGSGGNPIPPTYKGFITDRCPECDPGDLDFSMPGDGRWDIEWEFVPCPGESISFQFQGSNPYYWKLQPRGTKTPVVTLTINGVPAERTQDNFFVLEGGPWEGAQTVETTTVAGFTDSTQVTL